MTQRSGRQRVHLYVWYLEDRPGDFASVKALERDVAELVQQVLNQDYAALRAAPICKVHIERYAAVDQLQGDLQALAGQLQKRGPQAKVLALSDRVATKTFPSLLLLDYFVKTHSSETTTVDLEHVRIEGESFTAWLARLFPALPYLVLTVADHQECEDPVHYISKSVFQHPQLLAQQIKEALVKRRPEFWTKLRDYATRHMESWHTPGHNKGAAFQKSVALRPFFEAYTRNVVPMVFATDLSVSVPDLGDLSEPDADHPMAQAMNKSAEVFGAHRTLYCTNGTSTSNRVLLMTLLRPGEVVLIDRNCHKSVHQAVVLSGAVPYYLTPRFNERLGLWAPLSFDEITGGIQTAVDRGLEPKLIVLTNCTYDGTLLPIKELARFAHERGLLVHADEAWFAYGRFHPYYGGGPSSGRYNALDSEADFCVHSSHKVLAAFSQASMIHVGKHFAQLFGGVAPGGDPSRILKWLLRRFDSYECFEHQLHENLRYWLSTSPHYPMIATLDAATAQMGLEGPALLDRIIGHGLDLHRWAQQQGFAVTPEDLTPGLLSSYQLYGHDPLKFTIRVRAGQKQQLREHLEQQQQPHQWEKATERAVLFLLTVGTHEAQVESLQQALGECRDLLGRNDRERPTRKPDISGQVVVLPQDAHYASGEYLTLKQAKKQCQEQVGDQLLGPVACHMVTPYPPGIPTILPGMRISKKVIGWIEDLCRSGEEVHGLRGSREDAKIRVLSIEEYNRLKGRLTRSLE